MSVKFAHDFIYLWILSAVCAVQRDPSKRRVKPVEQHLLQIHFGMSDDDDTDSDYEFKPGAGSDDDIGSDEFDGVASDHGDVKSNAKPKGSDEHRDTP